ncbi:MAG: hypothetical protein ACI3VM_07230 [Oscillospiraceae bacterium]|nr:hypothetical protein [Oscillospiraceae bacterium]
MKRIIAVILAVMCAFALCACSDNGGAQKTETKTEYEADYGELYYASGDVKFGIFDPADEVLSALGEPVSTFESNSCAYQGKDKFYYYDGFEVLVNDVDGTERVTGITIADDTVSNPQGVKIGMKGDEALALMDGIEYTQSGDTYKFTVGSTLFRLQVGADGTVKAAEYSVAANDK